ncbi:alpha/beta hydrolase [Rosenbergiella australiborealis]|uniref:alpha/beta hydrolase n=1 Tax=Rosenbergiella australiborealis TaxID=1544696 RepID=UPI001F4ECA6D|nr:alpha/beta hydrolase-fold protein [Rosenbergiella australiborealis]
MLGIFKKSVVIALFVLSSPSVFSRPNMAPLGPSIADSGSHYYRFRSYQIASVDKQRHYKVWVAVPKKAAPQQGYPILYMLDGNSSLNRLGESPLQAMSEKHPAVLVFVGYDTPLPFDLAARAFDYTPPSNDPQTQNYMLGRGRVGGGSSIFRSLLEKEIIPLIEASLPINPAQRSLWGHSYGGLFVLDTYLHSHQFRHYFAASPSLDQGYQWLLNDIAAQTVNPASLTIMLGQTSNRSPTIDIRQQKAKWAQQRLAISIVNYPGLSHGAMFGASLQDTLKAVSQ